MNQPTKRSQPPRAESLRNRTIFSSLHGVAHVYTRRHIHGCTLRSPEQNHCACPKWIYSKARDGKAVQQAARTPSFTEAAELAQKILKGFDPEIRAAREITSPTPGILLDAALDRYFAELRSRQVTEGYLLHVRSCLCRRPARPEKSRRGPSPLNQSLMEFIDQANLRAVSPVRELNQISNSLLRDWAATWRTNDLTSCRWRTIANTFVLWAIGLDYLDHEPTFGKPARLRAGNRCGSFSDLQYDRLLECLPFYRPARGATAPAHYAERLRAFLELGRWAGMAMGDIVRFSPRVNLSANNVLIYRRAKNGSTAGPILLDPGVAARLRAIPPEAGSSDDQPLRFVGKSNLRNGMIWRERFQKLCRLAEIGPIETEVGSIREAHPHMLRDTFAIDAITRGVSLENVAKMLGHASVQMTEHSYLFWIEKRLDHCIEDQRSALTRLQVAPAALEEPGYAARRGSLVH